MSFESLGLISPILQALEKAGYENPSPVQKESIPVVLSGQDIVAAAQTGTGKTASFALPLLQLLAKAGRPQPNSVKALVLVPTRELATQVHQSFETYGEFMNVRSDVVFGGVKINPQMRRLCKGVDILIATPGRLLDLAAQNAIKFDHLNYLVLDEADRMLDLGFMPDLKRILAQLPKQRQNLFFSATFPDNVKKLLSIVSQKKAVSIEIERKNTSAKSVKQWLHPVDKKLKLNLLHHLIVEHAWQQVLVFVRTKRGANKVNYDLQKRGFESAAIHGDKSQSARNRALREFKAGTLQVLVATDIAARGIDIDSLPAVVNYDLPDVAEDYVHRIGRTGRAGEKGLALSLVCADEIDKLAAIETLLRKNIDREYVDDFIPAHDLPARAVKTPKKVKPHKKKMARQEQRKGSAPGNSRGKKVYNSTKKKPGKKPGKRPSAKKAGSRNAETGR